MPEQLCPTHHVPFKWVPDGVSKSTGKPYRGFWACQERGCRERPGGRTPNAPPPNGPSQQTIAYEDRREQQIQKAIEEKNHNIKWMNALNNATAVIAATLPTWLKGLETQDIGSTELVRTALREWMDWFYSQEPPKPKEPEADPFTRAKRRLWATVKEKGIPIEENESGTYVEIGKDKLAEVDMDKHAALVGGWLRLSQLTEPEVVKLADYLAGV